MSSPDNQNSRSLGLAMSGSGNRTSFYVGFLEELAKAGVKIDYISACSGASLVAAAYACGGLNELKNIILDMDGEKLKKLITRSKIKNGGIYSLKLVEDELLKITKGKSFEEVVPKMSFSAVDIESGELVNLCMGDIARAALISCTLPGVFEPVKWGERTLVDGGLLVMVPSLPLKLAGIDVCVGINMRGTKHIFTEGQMNLKRAFNFLKKILLVDYIDNLITYLFESGESEEADYLMKVPHLFTVLGKSMDLAIAAGKSQKDTQPECDLLITPNIPRMKQAKLNREAVARYYEFGRQTAKEYLPKIKELTAVRN